MFGIFSVLVALAACQSTLACIKVTLDDAFAPNCTHNPVVTRYCGPFDQGHYYLMVLNGKDEAPINYWEIKFTLEIESTGEMFTGGYNTTLVFDYFNNDFHLIHYQHMWSNTLNATTCGSSDYINDGECMPEPEGPSRPKRQYINKKTGRVDINKVLSYPPTSAPASVHIINRVRSLESEEDDNSTDAGSHESPDLGSVLVGARTRYPLKKRSSGKLIRVVSRNQYGGGGGGGGEEYNTSEPTLMPTNEPTAIPTSSPSRNTTFAPSTEEEWEEEGGGGGGSNEIKTKTLFQNLVRKRHTRIPQQKKTVSIPETDEEARGNETVIYEGPVVSTPDIGVDTVTNETESEVEDEDEEIGASVPVVSTKTHRKRSTRLPFLGSFGKSSDTSSEEEEEEEVSTPTNSTAVDEEENDTSSGSGLDVPEVGYGGRMFRKHHTRVPRSSKSDASASSSAEMTSEPTVSPTSAPSTNTTDVEDEEKFDSNDESSKDDSSKRSRVQILTRAPKSKISIPSGGSNEEKVKTYEPTAAPSGNVTYVDEDGHDLGIEKRNKIELPDKPSKDVNEEGTPEPTVHPTIRPTHPTSSPTLVPFTNVTVHPTVYPTVMPTEDEDEEGKGNEKKKVIKFKRTPNKAKPVKPSEASIPMEVKVMMYDDSGEGWFRPDYDGTMFYISDETQMELLAYGTLENGTYSGYCEYCIGEGSYYFRVGAKKQTKDVKWTFCGTNGSFAEQLAFHIEDGKCIADALLDADMVCEESYSSVVTVKAKISVAGVKKEIFGPKDGKVIADALANTVPGWDLDNIGNVTSSLDVKEMKRMMMMKGSRSLSSYTFDVEVEVSFVSEIAYEFAGTSYNGVKELVSYLEELLSQASASGELTSSIRTASLDLDDSQLSSVSSTEVLGVSLVDITYVGTKSIFQEEMEYVFESISETVDVGESSQTSSFSAMHAALFGAILSVGFVAFIGILVHTIRSHQGDGMSSKYVNPSDIDLSISNHYNSGHSTSRLNPISL
eukprot:gene10112-21072_t